VIIELGGPDLAIRLGNVRGDVRDTTARDQLPDAFYL
jgi:cytidine deaminase